MEKQIKGYANGGGIANIPNPLLEGNPLLTQKFLPSVQSFTPPPMPAPLNKFEPTAFEPTPGPLPPYRRAEDEEDPIDALSKQLLEREEEQDEEVRTAGAKNKTFDERFQEYQSRLAPLFSQETRRPNIYDLALRLSEGIAASDPTAGPYAGLARGFVAYSKDLRKQADEAKQIQQQIALKAFEMARSDEKAAEEYLQKMQLELLKQGNKGVKYVRWAIPETDESGKETGKIIYKSAPETDVALQEKYRLAGGYPDTGGGTSVTVGGGSSSKILETTGKNFANAISKWQEEAELARTQKNLLQTAAKISADLPEDQRGQIANLTVGARQFLSELGVWDGSNIPEQELVRSFGTRIAMGLVGQTKGAISNAEMNLFLSSSPGLAMTKGGYEKLIGYLNRINQKTLDFNDAYNQAVLNGEFDEAYETGNDAKIAAAVGAWQSRWHNDNPLFLPSELAEIQALADSEDAVARKFRIGLIKSTSATPQRTDAVDVSSKF
jgi:hypothetical protein